MRVLLLSRYGRQGASSRVRSLQYLPILKSAGIAIDINPLFSDEYLNALYNNESRLSQVVIGYWKRIQALLSSRKYDLVWIEKEALPFFPAFAERILAAIGPRYIVDYDDALFHRYDDHRNRFVRFFLGRKIDAVMRRAALVVAGNEYLADRATAAGAKQIEIVPTVVDLSRYSAVTREPDSELVVGWIGSPMTSRYLSTVAPVIELMSREFEVRFLAIGASKDELRGLPVEVEPWTEEGEVKSIQGFDVGIMPLLDSPWERGKCGYKLLQYMACGLPVVASPVGVNKKIVVHGENGFLAEGVDEWHGALRRLLQNRELRREMGRKGRALVQNKYSLQVQAPRLEKIIRSFSIE